ncbi:hypothetical protein PR202_ga19441 [Eleusine coracana subsp. coracana]|uniref:Transmembrane protein n=1 Tax=Eleusine coracana subsp. coracana TaxID=191504 RepID=A0AAV5CVK2_ELECO|nr:hypothetical protein QOZ80_4AG0308000 [Eleusine coracana subsp. coracana]GJN02119.1 hypothetical protein PR202_ga19441 [Eleusine coracana subsp. coracana]
MLLVEEIKGKVDFLRCLLLAEGVGAPPASLNEAKDRFAFLDQLARSLVAGPDAEEEEETKGLPREDDDGNGSGSACSCTDSCQEEAAAGDAQVDDATDNKGGMEVAATAEEAAASDAVAEKKRDTEQREAGAVPLPREEAAVDANAEKRDAAEHQAAAETRRTRAVWWRRSAAWCGAAGVVTVVAVGVAVELAAVARHNVYVVPT